MASYELKVDVSPNKRSKNSFGNSFAISNNSFNNESFISQHDTQKQNINISKVSYSKPQQQIPKKQELRQIKQVNKINPQQNIKINRKNRKRQQRLNEIIEIVDKTQKFQKPKPRQQKKNKGQTKKYMNSSQEENQFQQIDIKNKFNNQKQQFHQKIIQNKKQNFNNLRLKNKWAELQQIEYTPKQVKNNRLQNPDKQKTKINEMKNNLNKLNSSIHELKQNVSQFDTIQNKKEPRLFSDQKQLKKQVLMQQIMARKYLTRQPHILIKKSQKSPIKRQQPVIAIISFPQQKKARQNLRHFKKLSQNQKAQSARKLLQKYKQYQPFHIRKQKEFQLFQQRIKEEEQEIILERKERFRSLQIDQIQQHKHAHQQRLQELMHARQDQREEEQRKINQDNNLMKDQIWKGISHDIVHQQILQKRRKKRQPKQKLKKMKNYYQSIRQSLPLPKTNPSKNVSIHSGRISQTLGNYSGRYTMAPQQILAHYNPNKKHIKKYKYIQGKAIGSVIQYINVPKTYGQQKKIGEGYLQYIKGLPKKKIQDQTKETQIDRDDLEMLSRKFNQVAKVNREKEPFYQVKQTAKKISIDKLGDKPTRNQVNMVISQLRNQDMKLKSKRQLIKVSQNAYQLQKQLNKNMVLNMQRKLDLLTKL